MKLSFIERIVLGIIKHFCPNIRDWVRFAISTSIEQNDLYCEMLCTCDDKDQDAIEKCEETNKWLEIELAKL